MENKDTNKDVWTVKEAAVYVNKSEQTVRRWCKQGIIPHIKIKRTIYLPTSKIKKMFLL